MRYTQKERLDLIKKFLESAYKNTVVLENGASAILVSPELQGRVMTSTLDGNKGTSFGWINHDVIASGQFNEQFNALGGEERFWLGPEGGQFSLYFPQNAPFDFKNWKVPAVIDSKPFDMVSRSDTKAVFNKKTALVNYSGFAFELDITRIVELLSKEAIQGHLNLDRTDYKAVAYKTSNKLKNVGNQAWTKETGALSIWLLCMLNPSPEVTVVAPIKEGDVSVLGAAVNDNYFGKIASDRLKATDKTVFFKADGRSRGKIGITPKRATKFIGSYDAENNLLTLLEIDKPKATDPYVNSAWEIQEDPFSGDVINSYNDGPLEDGGQLGPFYELESSSPALFLGPEESYTHVQKMYHFSGTKEALDAISIKTIGVPLDEIERVFK